MDCFEVNTKKEVYLEILRIIAICFVIFNHTGLNGYWLFTQRTPDTLFFYIYLFLSLFCKFAVPLFMAISGAVLLGRTDEPVKKNRQRIFRIVTVLVVYSFVFTIGLSGRMCILMERLCGKAYSW